MNKYRQADKIISMRRYAGKLDSKASALIHKVREHTEEHIHAQLRNMLDKADDALFDLANKADSNASQQLYFDAMRGVRLQRSAIESGLSRTLQETFERFIRGEDVLREQDTDELNEELSLELVDDESMEEQIAIKNMASKAERECYHELFELTVRLAAVTKRNELEERSHPLHPAAIAQSFGETLSPLDINIGVKLIIYKLYDKYVMSDIHSLHKELNRLLVREGVLPKIKRVVRRNGPSGGYRGAGPVAAPPGTPAGAAYEDGGAAGGYYGSPYAGAAGPAAGGQEGGAPIEGELLAGFPGVAGYAPDASSLVGALSSIQYHVVENGYPDDLTPREVGVQVLRMARRFDSSPGQDRTMDEKTISMVSMVFDYILDDEHVPEAIKALLARLQIPVLKLALIDEEFFTRRQHPARQLLNEVAQASIGYDFVNEHGETPLLNMVAEIVDEVLFKFEGDPTVFETLLERFLAWRDKQQERATLFEERARKTREGKERVQFAKQRTEAWVEMWAGRDGVPDFVRSFLRDVWKDTLLISMHRWGEESTQWARCIRTVNNLLWSLTPKKTEQGKKLLLEMIPGIVADIRQGMALAAAHPDTMERFFNDLAAYHAKTVRGFDRNVYETEVASPTTDEHTASTADTGVEDDALAAAAAAAAGDPELQSEIADIDRRNVEEIILETPEADARPSNEQRDEFYEAAESLECGSWVQMSGDGDEPVRAKLSWKSPLSGCCLFVDRKGMKVAEKTVSGLAAELRSGRAKVIDEVPLLDRAISKLMARGEDGIPILEVPA